MMISILTTASVVGIAGIESIVGIASVHGIHFTAHLQYVELLGVDSVLLGVVDLIPGVVDSVLHGAADSTAGVVDSAADSQMLHSVVATIVLLLGVITLPIIR